MKKIILGGLILTMSFALLTGCGGQEDNGENSQVDVLSGKVVIAGSTSVQPLSEELAEAFKADYPEVTVEIQGGGSSVGVKSANDGIADIGAASRELKSSEENMGLTTYVIAKDGIAVIANAEGTTDDITLEEARKIFMGEITNWKELGGDDTEIIVVSREEGSGTRGAFTEIAGVLGKNDAGEDVDMTTQNALVQPSTGAVKQTVATTPNSIGYISLAALDNTVKAMKIEGVEATAENIINGSYKISRPFLYLTKGKVSEVTQTFIDFVMNEGQEIVKEEFISVK